MASLVAKTVHGRRSWQIVTCQRVNGQPRQVVLAHLGTADALLRKLQHAKGKPLKARLRDFGLLAAAYQIARQLQLVELIDQHIPKRHQGPSVGQYLLLAALNRLAQPTSKAQLASWFATTTLRRWLPFSKAALRSQRFWDHMAPVDEPAIQRIEAELSRRLVERFAIDLRCLCFDCTNFDTFIDSQTAAELPQRGHAKSKRTDLRVVGLALLVSTDFAIPLFSQTYPGNQPDAVTLASVTDTLAERYRMLARELEHITLVFDKGNNSQENLRELADGPYHVIGSLVPTQHPELLAVPQHRFQALDDRRLPGVTAYRTTRELYGRCWTIVVTRSVTLLRGQLRGIAQHLRKRRRALAELQRKLERSQRPGAKGKGYTLASLQHHADKLGQGQYVKELLRIEVGEAQGRLFLSYRTDRQALERLKRTVLGKRILFSDNHDWSTAALILGYRSQHHVEGAFRQMKGRTGLSWGPVHHWTDQKIRVHSFYCVLALLLLKLLQHQAWRAGIAISVGRLAEELSQLREVLHLSPGSGPGKAGRYRAETSYTEGTPLGARLAQLFQLEQLQVH
jgi:transposase